MKQYTFQEVKHEHSFSGAYYDYKGFEFIGKHDQEFTLKMFLMNLRASNFHELIKPIKKQRHKLFELAVHLRYINKSLAISHMKPLFDKSEWNEIIRFQVRKCLI